MGRGHLKAGLTDQKMLLIGRAAVVGVINAPCRLGIALASRWKFGDSAEFPPPTGSDFVLSTQDYFLKHILKNKSVHKSDD